MFPAPLLDDATALLALMRSKGLTLTTVESCTGGLVSALLTAIPGSSDVVDSGFVTYSNAAKIAMVHVPEATLADHGAVSAETARAMALGARAMRGVDLAVAITGIAGPGGGSETKPVGLVHFAIASDAGCETAERRFGEIGRDAVRQQSVAVAMGLLRSAAVGARDRHSHRR